MNYFPPKPLFSVRSLRQKHISTPDLWPNAFIHLMRNTTREHLFNAIYSEMWRESFVYLLCCVTESKMRRLVTKFQTSKGWMRILSGKLWLVFVRLPCFSWCFCLKSLFSFRQSFDKVLRKSDKYAAVCHIKSAKQNMHVCRMHSAEEEKNEALQMQWNILYNHQTYFVSHFEFVCVYSLGKFVCTRCTYVRIWIRHFNTYTQFRNKFRVCVCFYQPFMPYDERARWAHNETMMIIITIIFRGKPYRGECTESNTSTLYCAVYERNEFNPNRTELKWSEQSRAKQNRTDASTTGIS